MSENVKYVRKSEFWDSVGRFWGGSRESSGRSIEPPKLKQLKSTTCKNITKIQSILIFITRLSLRMGEIAFPRTYNFKIFWGRMPPDPPEGGRVPFH